MGDMGDMGDMEMASGIGVLRLRKGNDRRSTARGERFLAQRRTDAPGGSRARRAARWPSPAADSRLFPPLPIFQC
jgi:hypothetical protein